MASLNMVDPEALATAGEGGILQPKEGPGGPVALVRILAHRAWPVQCTACTCDIQAERQAGLQRLPRVLYLPESQGPW